LGANIRKYNDKLHKLSLKWRWKITTAQAEADNSENIPFIREESSGQYEKAAADALSVLRMGGGAVLADELQVHAGAVVK
jgi:hypothetical protein